MHELEQLGNKNVFISLKRAIHEAGYLGTLNSNCGDCISPLINTKLRTAGKANLIFFMGLRMGAAGHNWSVVHRLHIPSLDASTRKL